MIDLISKISSNWVAILFVAVFVYIIYKARADKKQQTKAEAMLPQLANLHRKESVFLCKWADIFEGSEASIQMQGLITCDITNKNKVVCLDGSEHTIKEIYPLTDKWQFDNNYKNPVEKIEAGRKIILVMSGDNWKLPTNMGQSNTKYFPEWANFLQKIKEEKVVVLNLK